MVLVEQDRRSPVDSERGASQTRARSDLDVMFQQLWAIAAFNLDQRRTLHELTGSGRSREARLDEHRGLEVVRRQHDALVRQLDLQLGRSVDVMHQRAALGRVLIAHRQAWFVERVSGLLRADGLDVVLEVEDGANAVGGAVAEQPDLVLLEDRLSSVPGVLVTQAIRRYCPDTLVLVQVESSDRVAALLDAGADAVVTRQVPPADVAAQLRALLQR